jgi:GNAT superfamily N-acetyltransferase
MDSTSQSSGIAGIGITTLAEIRQQPDLWPTTLARVAQGNLDEFLRRTALICGAGTSAYEVKISGEQIWVAGVGSVLTHKEYRGQGFGRAGLRAAEEFVLKEWGIDFMLLFCRPALEKWYGCLGWFRIDAPVWIEQDQGEDQGEILAPLPTLVKMLSPKPWPKSAVYLRSLPW